MKAVVIGGECSPSYTEKCGIQVGQIYVSASGHRVRVVDVITYAFCDDVVVEDLESTKREVRRIDAWKLAVCRYTLEK